MDFDSAASMRASPCCRVGRSTGPRKIVGERAQGESLRWREVVIQPERAFVVGVVDGGIVVHHIAVGQLDSGLQSGAVGRRCGGSDHAVFCKIERGRR